MGGGGARARSGRGNSCWTMSRGGAPGRGGWVCWGGTEGGGGGNGAPANCWGGRGAMAETGGADTGGAGTGAAGTGGAGGAGGAGVGGVGVGGAGNSANSCAGTSGSAPEVSGVSALLTASSAASSQTISTPRSCVGSGGGWRLNRKISAATAAPCPPNESSAATPKRAPRGGVARRAPGVTAPGPRYASPCPRAPHGW